MPNNTTATVNLGIDWRQVSTEGDQSLVDAGSIETDNSTFASGNSALDGTLNNLWHDKIDLPTGGQTTIDLTNLPRKVSFEFPHVLPPT